MDVDRSGTTEVVISPHLGQDLLAAPHPIRVLDKEPQQLVLHIGQVLGIPRNLRLVGGRVQFEVLEPQYGVATLDRLDRTKPAQSDAKLDGMLILRRGNRLSITPVEPKHFRRVCQLGGWKAGK